MPVQFNFSKVSTCCKKNKKTRKKNIFHQISWSTWYPEDQKIVFDDSYILTLLYIPVLMIKTKMRHFNKDWKQVDWKLSIARISFTEISNEFCISVVGYSRGRGGKQKCFRTRNSRTFWISKFGTYKNGSCP